ncbi:MAG TPA: PAS domain S-box protein [Myxococcaceae bacterium]|nr:PAS domain S-box protein [Myxococcaceae bacterium]
MGFEPATTARSLAAAAPPDAAWLVVTSSSTPGTLGRIFQLDTAETALGRAPDAEVRLLDDGVSRRHARIVRAGDGSFELHDLASTNGTFHNGVRLEGSVRLAEGDKIQLGGHCTLRFSWKQSAQADDELREALAAARVGTFSLELPGASVAWSEAVEAVVGAPPRSIPRTARPLAEFVDAQDLPRVTAALEHATAGRHQLEAEFRFASPAGAGTWVALRGDVLRDEEDVPERVVGTVMDISARKTAEQELRRQALMFESFNDAVALVDLHGSVLDWNGSAERLFGHPRAEVQGRPYQQVLGLEGEDLGPPAIQAALKRYGRWNRELTARRRDGAPCFCEVTVVPLRGADGRHLASLAVHRDVGERRAMQAQLVLASRMAAVGTLAAGVAHEINNPLAFINANLAWLQEEIQTHRAGLGEAALDQVTAVVREARTGIDRIADIVRELKAFARVEAEDAAAPVDIRKALAFALKMADPELRKRARVVAELAEVPPVLGSEGRLAQVFLNLLLNAAQAIPEGSSSTHEISVRCQRRDRTVAVEVGDTGRGIPPELQARIFDPFFTTRPVGEATGLGLSICHSIVRGLGGEISVRSTVDQGSTFSVLLPAHLPNSTAQAAADAGEDRGSGVRVLVVDDEPFICSAIQRLLRRECLVSTATSGREALGLVAAGQRFDVILSDLMMPEMSGEDLLRALREEAPDQAARVVIMTGGAFTPRSEEFLRSLTLPHLTKPLTLDNLRAAIDGALQHAPAAA